MSSTSFSLYEIETSSLSSPSSSDRGEYVVYDNYNSYETAPTLVARRSGGPAVGGSAGGGSAGGGSAVGGMAGWGGHPRSQHQQHQHAPLAESARSSVGVKRRIDSEEELVGLSQSPSQQDLFLDPPLLRAVTFVQDAILARDVGHRMDPTFLSYFRFYKMTRTVCAVVAVLYLLLSWLERPASFQFLTPWQCLAAEAVILVILGSQAAFEVYAYSPEGFGRYLAASPGWRVIELLVLVLNIADACTFAYQLQVHGREDFPRFSRVLRPFYCLNVNDVTRDQGKLIFMTLGEMAPKLFTIVSFVGFFSIIGFLIFYGGTTLDGQPYFDTYFTSFTELFVTLTSSNFPDVMLPALKESTAYSAFFVVYIVLGALVGLQIVLGFNYTIFRSLRDKEEAEDAERREAALALAFEQLSTRDRDGGDHKSISRMRFMQLFRHFRPEMTQEDGARAFEKMDVDGSNSIDIGEFEVLADTLFLSFKAPVAPVKPTYARIWLFMHSNLWQGIMSGVVLGAGAVNVWTLQVAKTVFSPRWPFFLDLTILGFFCLDLCIKMVALGPRRMLKSFWGVFDLTIVLISVIAKIVIEIVFGNRPDLFAAAGSSPERIQDVRFIILRYACVLRSLKILMALSIVRPLRNLSVTVASLSPVLFKFVYVIALAFYSFSALAVEMFRGALDPVANPSLLTTEYYTRGYAEFLTFDTFAKSTLTHFVLLQLNGWEIIMYSVSTTTSRYAVIYFIAFYLIVVVILLNLTVAFLLDSVAFNLEIIKKKAEEKLRRGQDLLKEKGSDDEAAEASGEGKPAAKRSWGRGSKKAKGGGKASAAEKDALIRQAKPPQGDEDDPYTIISAYEYY